MSTEKLHPTSGTHPSHKWFNTDEGEWRCACGADVTFVMAKSSCSKHCALYPSPMHDRYNNAITGSIIERLAGKYSTDDFYKPRTERERCEWAGVLFSESNYQYISEERYEMILATAPADYHVGAFDTFFSANEIREAQYMSESARESERWVMQNVAHAGVGGKRRALEHTAEKRSFTRRLYHRKGGIVRHGCEERR